MCEPVSALDVPSNITDVSGVVFADEASICAVGPAGSASQFLVADDSIQDLKQFFGRPTLIARGSLSASPVNLYTLAISWTNLVAELPLFAERLRGVRGIRADLVFTVEHNCNPFQQGLLVSCFQYGNGQFSRATRPASCTHLPHVRLDVAHNTRAVLKVPFLSELEYIGSSDSEVSHVMGTYALTQVLGTPALAGSPTPVYKVYLHFENIEVFGRMPLSSTAFVVPQAGVARAPPPGSVSERELASNGQISGILATAAAVPSAVGRAFPTIRGIMASATWFLNASAKAASAFGFSKPVASAALARHVRYPNFAENAIDMVAPASVVGAFQSNTVAVTPALGGTDLDEMAFDNVLTRYSQIFRGAMTTADAHTTVEYVSKVCLMHMWFRSPGVADGGNIALPRGSAIHNAVLPSTLMYFAQHFRYWNGGLRYRITFAKSKFHTGRVMFSFIPTYQQVANVNTYSDVGFSGGPVPGVLNTDLQPSQYSTVFDLKDGSEFEFDVPYIAPLPHTAINDSLGMVSMQVMDPLVNNGESSSTITFIVEVAALPGFYFSGIGSPGQPAWSNPSPPNIEFQSGVGGSYKDASQDSVGEKFLSVKQLIMYPTTRRNDIANAVINRGVVPLWFVNPGWGAAAPLTATQTRNWALPRGGMAAQCYAYGTGSTLAHFFYPSSTNSAVKVILGNRDNNSAVTGTVPSVYNQVLDSPNTAYSNLMLNTANGGQFLLPTLALGPRFAVGDYQNLSTSDWDLGTSETTSSSRVIKSVYHWLTRNNDGGARNVSWGVAAADDARLAAFIGPPPLVLANSGATVASWWNANMF